MSDIATMLSDATTKMNKAVEVAKDDFAAVRTGRAHPNMFSKIAVDYYGTMTPLSQLASIQVPEARTAIVTPFDKGAMAGIEKAIRDSDLGVNPATDGGVIRVNFPQLTEERRKEMVKLVKSEAENAKVAVRNIRRDANESLKKLVKDKAISEDDEKRGLDEVQEVVEFLCEQPATARFVSRKLAMYFIADEPPAALVERMAQLDGAEAQTYRTRAKTFLEKWQQAIQRWETEAAPLKGMITVGYHKNMTYLDNWLGILGPGAMPRDIVQRLNAVHLTAEHRHQRVGNVERAHGAACTQHGLRLVDEDKRQRAFFAASPRLSEEIPDHPFRLAQPHIENLRTFHVKKGPARHRRPPAGCLAIRLWRLAHQF